MATKKKDPKRVRAGKRSRKKGHKFENLNVHRMRTIYPGSLIYRGKQGSEGGHAPGEGCDVEGTPFYIECKHEQEFNWRRAYRQALEKTSQRGDKRPIVIIGRDDKNPPGWKVGDLGTPDMAVLKLDDFCALLEQMEQQQSRIVEALIETGDPPVAAGVAKSLGLEEEYNVALDRHNEWIDAECAREDAEAVGQ